MNTSLEQVYALFRKLNSIPRPSHHEQKVADFLCQYAESLGLEHERDANNCVVIRKPATPGHETAEPIVLLNHMDMVAVGDGSRPFNPLTDGIDAYVEDGWMKAHGTSLGADNGIGLSMALAVLADDSIVHGPIEVLTTTNEEDGMTGAANLSADFIQGRKVINLDSEDYDTITVGAAGAYLQEARIPIHRITLPHIDSYYCIQIQNGLGGHSGVDINKGRINANQEMCHIIRALSETCCPSLHIAEINGGNANASIPGNCTAIVAVNSQENEELIRATQLHAGRLKEMYPEETNLSLTIKPIEYQQGVIASSESIARMVDQLPCGVIRMHPTMPGTTMTSNNIGMIRTEDHHLMISCHTRSFNDSEMEQYARICTTEFENNGAQVSILMNTPGWQENQESDYIKAVSQTFDDVLHFTPRQVAMHFVLEAGYYVRKYPGIEIACIGPRIIEPHSTKERVELSTIDNIYRVLMELLQRMA